ncbi:MAG: phytanoyl-CoA dioxygenase family protein [Acidimicrobiales bacterium]
MSEAPFGLSAEQQRQFTDTGVLVLPGFYSHTEVDGLRDRMDKMVDAFDPDSVSTVFSTTDRQHDEDEYFLTSGDTVRFFFEEGAHGDDGTLRVPKHEALNKVGHAMHDLDPVFSGFSRKPELAAVARDIGFVDPLLLQSMYIFKQPRIGGEVVWHTDHPFLWTEPRSVVGFWVALEDATVENGCLWCLPGKHRLPAKQRFRRTTSGNGTTMDTLDDSPFPEDEGVPLEAEKGTLVLIDGLLPHWSAPNTSDRSRHAYTLHVIDGTANYPSDNWLQRSPELPLRGFSPSPAS